jgi:histidyl-tRNA synthetase
LILEQKKLETTTDTEYLFVHFEATQKESLALMQRFLSDKKIVEYYPSADKLAKQFAYADKKGIPYVVIL